MAASITVLGTLGFLAPEQIGSPDRVDGAADVYALGATLYQCLAGHPPFAADNAMKLMHSHLHEAPRDLAERAPGAPAALCALVMACLAKDPSARPAASAVAAQLAAIALADRLPPWSAALEIGGEAATRRLRAPAMAGPTEPFVVDQSGVGPAQP